MALDTPDCKFALNDLKTVAQPPWRGRAVPLNMPFGTALLHNSPGHEHCKPRWGFKSTEDDESCEAEPADTQAKHRL